jgi:hypothetical protein
VKQEADLKYFVTLLSFYCITKNMLAKFLSVITAIFFISGCKCGDETCHALKPEYNDWIPYQVGDIVKFVNDSGYEVDFTVSDRKISESYIIECGRSELGGCYCHDCAIQPSYFYATTSDNTWHVSDSLGNTILTYNSLYTNITQPDPDYDKVKAQYAILDQTNEITIGPAYTVTGDDILLPSLTLGGVTYNNVIVHESDTAIISPNPAYNVHFVFKSYYNKEYGVFAFYDLKTQSLFYRKP